MLLDAGGLNSVEHFVSALRDVSAFSHASCDAILEQRHMDVASVFLYHKSPSERNGIGNGLATILGFEGVLLILFVVTRMRGDAFRRAKLTKWVLPFMALAGLFSLAYHLYGIARYDEICRSLLSQR